MPIEIGEEAPSAVVSVVPRIGEIEADDWDACANPDPITYNPFISHAFLKALEDSGSVGARTGWLPQHLVTRGKDGEVSGCMPTYVKTHSQGEFVFDHAWAQAYAAAGGDYYPKLQAAVPFTPVPGRRLLTRPGPDAQSTALLLAAGGAELVRRLEASSLHITFLTKQEWSRLTAAGFLGRTDQQFHWLNPGYQTFDDFLGALSSRKRKTIRNERATAVSGDLDIEHVSGAAITEAHWDAMFAFYMDTGNRKWGRPYLNRAFFSVLGNTMADRCLLILARRDRRYVAGALNLIGGDCLYGRYWGAIEHYPCLHFEICYYQAIDYAIAHGLARVEAGAQGEHKLARGYMPSLTYSAHWIADPGLRQAIARYLQQERRAVAAVVDELGDAGPYRKRDCGGDP